MELILGDSTQLLNLTNQDPSLLTDLMIRLIDHPSSTFDRLLQIQPIEGILQGLQVPVPSINLVTLAFLEKSTVNPVDISRIAVIPELAQAWISLWLSTPDTQVGARAGKVLEKVLRNGAPSGPLEMGQNPMVRRIFRDEGVYRTIFTLCDPKSRTDSHQLTRRQKTIAQGRLLTFVIDLDGSSSPMRSSQLPDVEKEFGMQEGGLFQFAFCSMSIEPDDVLMQSVYIQACARVVARRDSNDKTSWVLSFFKKNGIQQRIIGCYLSDDSDTRFLYRDAADYIAAYAVWSEDFVANRGLLVRILTKLGQTFHDTSKAEWESSGKNASSDLVVAGALPRIIYVPDAERYTGVPPPVYDLPDNVLDQGIIDTLAKIFCRADDSECKIARLIYYLYLHRHPCFWSNIASAAVHPLLDDVALAAIRLMESFLFASWAPLCTESRNDDIISLPSESQLGSMVSTVPSNSLPIEGWQALLLDKAASDAVIPYLLQSTGKQSWKVSVAKHELTEKIRDKLQAVAPEHPGIRGVLTLISQKVSQGPGDRSIISGTAGVAMESG